MKNIWSEIQTGFTPENTRPFPESIEIEIDYYRGEEWKREEVYQANAN